MTLAAKNKYGERQEYLPSRKWVDGSVSDDLPAYARAQRSVARLGALSRRVYANPARGPGGDPVAAFERDRQMFPVDLLHKLWRHTQAHHRRETIAFGRRHNAVLERGFLLAVWRNLVKARSERRPDPTTPAMRLGLTDQPWTWARVLARRLFAWRIPLPQRWLTVYRREWLTPELGPNRPHNLINAF